MIDKIKSWLPVHSDEGSVAIEIGVMTPLLILIIWFIAAGCFVWRLEGATHRATAALADVLANQRTSTDEDLIDRLDRLSSDNIATIFLDMVAGDETVGAALRESMQYGIQVSYYDTINETYSELNSIGGMQCTKPDKTLKEYGSTGNLVTSSNKGALDLVMVTACVGYSGFETIGDLVFPTQFSSTFIATRRDD